MAIRRSKTYSALVVGAGRIGATFDTPKSKDFLTHAHAFDANPRIDLNGIVDTNFSRAKSAARIWRTQAFLNIAEAVANVRPDIISVCVSTDQHLSVVREICSLPKQLRPQVLFLEKPVAYTQKDRSTVARLLAAAKIEAIVNYSRRFDKTVRLLRDDIQKSKFGRLQAVNGVYSKGLMNNASHMINLLDFLGHPIVEFLPLTKLIDYKKSDPTISGFGQLKGGSAFSLVGCNENNYSIFEIDLFFEKAKLSFVQSGLFYKIEKVRIDPVYKGYRDIGPSIKLHKTSLTNALKVAVAEIVETLDRQLNFKKNASSLESALQSDQWCETILQNARRLK